MFYIQKYDAIFQEKFKNSRENTEKNAVNFSFFTRCDKNINIPNFICGSPKIFCSLKSPISNIIEEYLLPIQF